MAIEREFDKIQDAKLRKTNQIKEQQRREQAYENMKKSKLRKQRVRSFLIGFLRFVVFIIFIFLVQDSITTQLKITPSFFTNESIQRQLFRDLTGDLPVRLRSEDKLKDFLLRYEEKLVDPNNMFFRENRILPHIIIQTYRQKERPCASKIYKESLE